jgi:hypothetical protein
MFMTISGSETLSEVESARAGMVSFVYDLRNASLSGQYRGSIEYGREQDARDEELWCTHGGHTDCSAHDRSVKQP